MITDGTPIRAYDIETGNFIGEFDSMSKAARRLFIRNESSISHYLYGGKGTTFKGHKKGVASYKDGKRYHFELVNKKAA